MMRIPYHSHFLMRESHYRYVCCHHWPVGFKLTHPSVSIDHGAVSSGARSQGRSTVPLYQGIRSLSVRFKSKWIVLGVLGQSTYAIYLHITRWNLACSFTRRESWIFHKHGGMLSLTHNYLYCGDPKPCKRIESGRETS